jgi:hypothetical protein
MAKSLRAPMRIRNVNPKVFLNYELDDKELETGLPLFKALVGLWCHADREGRFRWDYRKLQIVIFPSRSNLDFSRILSELSQLQIVEQYQVDGKDYGWLPTFKDYQYVSGNEPPSELPGPPSDSSVKAPGGFRESSTRRQTQTQTTDVRRLTADADNRLEPEAPRASSVSAAPHTGANQSQSGQSEEPSESSSRLAEFWDEQTEYESSADSADFEPLLRSHDESQVKAAIRWALKKSNHWSKPGVLEGSAGFAKAFPTIWEQFQKYLGKAGSSGKKPAPAVEVENSFVVEDIEDQDGLE